MTKLILTNPTCTFVNYLSRLYKDAYKYNLSFSGANPNLSNEISELINYTSPFTSLELIIELPNDPQRAYIINEFLKRRSKDMIKSVEVYYDDCYNDYGKEVLENIISENIKLKKLQRIKDNGTNRKTKFSPTNFVNLQIDTESNPKASFIGGVHLPIELASLVHYYGAMHEKYWYWDETSASEYMTLLADESYQVFDQSKILLNENLKSILLHIKEKCDKLDVVEFFALGVGSGEKEVDILKQLLTEFNKVVYTLVDVSFPLLQHSLRSVYSDQELINAIKSNKLIVNPILSDFLQLDLKSLIKELNSIKIFAPLGVLWNVPVSDLLNDNFMGILREVPNSFILFDVEFINQRPDDNILNNYKNEHLYKLLYHPLSLLVTVAIKDPTQRFQHLTRRNLLPLYNVFSVYACEEDKLEKMIALEIINNSNENDYIEVAEKYKLGSRAHRAARYIGLDKIRNVMQNSKTILIIYKFLDKRIHDDPYSIILGYSTRFEESHFNEYLNRFEYLKYIKFPERSSTFSYYLCMNKAR